MNSSPARTPSVRESRMRTRPHAHTHARDFVAARIFTATAAARACSAHRYLHGWFAVDLIGALPWDLTQARVLKLLKLLRAFHLRKPIAKETGKSVNVRRVLNILMYFLIGAHWVRALACAPIPRSAAF